MALVDVEVWEIEVFCFEGENDVAKGSALITFIVLCAGLIRSLLEVGARATLSASSKDSFFGQVGGVFELDAKGFVTLGLVEFCPTDITVREASFWYGMCGVCCSYAFNQAGFFGDFGILYEWSFDIRTSFGPVTVEAFEVSRMGSTLDSSRNFSISSKFSVSASLLSS